MPELTRPIAWLTLAGALGLGAACSTSATPAAAANPAAPVAVVKSLGGRQCEGAGTNPAALGQALRQAGLQVLAEGCAHDGRMRPAVCGAPDGVMALFEIPADQLQKAEALGYAALASLPDARRQVCR